MKNFHLKLAIGILVVFGLLLLGFALWTPVRVKYYAWQYRSPDVSERVKAVDGFIKLGEPGIEKLKAIYPDGPEAVVMLIECWDNPGQRIEDKNRAFAFLKLEKGWEVYPDCVYTSLSCQKVAAFNGYLETVKLFMKKGGFINCHGDLAMRKPDGKEKGWAYYTYKSISGAPIHAAAFSGRNHVIGYMLSQGIDVDAKDVEGTPLHYAAKAGHTKTAAFLISKGADIDATNNGWTPLNLAAWHDRTATAEFLISKGADVNAKDNQGCTSLHWAAICGKTATAEFIISQGAHVDAKDYLGRIPMHWAARYGHTKTTELLISKGADVNATDKDGETALDLAINEGHKETEKLLRSHGAKTRKELRAEKP